MAPELLVSNLQLKDATMEDLKRADIWAYGMVVFNIINPGLKHPYQKNVECHTTSSTPLTLLQEFAKKGEKPMTQEKYVSRHLEDWAGLKKIYETCTMKCPTSRPPINEVLKMIRAERHSTTSESELETHLRISQFTSVENVDQELQKNDQGKDCQQSFCNSSDIPDDATNACAFLTIMIANELHEMEEIYWDVLAETVETIILTFPRVLNKFRDISSHYDVMEAHMMLRENHCLPDRYYLTEEIPYPDDALSEPGKRELVKALTSMAVLSPTFGFYTCEKFIFLIGSYNSDMFVIDTHPVPPSAGRRFTSILKRFCGSNIEAAKACCSWLWQRLESSNLNGPQSLSLMIQKNVQR